MWSEPEPTYFIVPPAKHTVSHKLRRKSTYVPRSYQFGFLKSLVSQRSKEV